MEDYMVNFGDIFPLEKNNTILTIENTFTRLEYDDHKDAIYAVVVNEVGTGRDLAFHVTDMYISHMYSCLCEQGVYLDKTVDIPFDTMAIIFEKVGLLGSEHVSEILSTLKFEIEETHIEMVSKIICELADVEISVVLPYITRVSPRVISYITSVYSKIHNEPAIDYTMYKKRILSYGTLTSVKAILDDIGVLGYDLASTIVKYRDEIIRTDNKDIVPVHTRAINLYKLALGSNEATGNIKNALLAITEQLSLDGKDLLALNAEIFKLEEISDDNT